MITQGQQWGKGLDEDRGITGTGTMVTDGLPLGFVWFQDTSLVAVALLCMQEVSFDT